MHCGRSKAAFKGRLLLPFIETLPPKNVGKPRMVWLPHSDETVVYRVSDGGCDVLLRSAGEEGVLRGVGVLINT